jgi:hypothetical protein
MKLKTMVLSMACVLCWIVLFPLFVIGGSVALLVLAAGTELAQLLTGTAGQGIDPAAARAMAMRICFGHRAGARAQGRLTR